VHPWDDYPSSADDAGSATRRSSSLGLAGAIEELVPAAPEELVPAAPTKPGYAFF
jgi:hypothetical protein